jgi:hypothetical protein
MRALRWVRTCVKVWPSAGVAISNSVSVAGGVMSTCVSPVSCSTKSWWRKKGDDMVDGDGWVTRDSSIDDCLWCVGLAGSVSGVCWEGPAVRGSGCWFGLAVGAWWRDGMVWRWEILVGAWRRDAVPAAWRRWAVFMGATHFAVELGWIEGVCAGGGGYRLAIICFKLRRMCH